jgi:hypothetical protein
VKLKSRDPFGLRQRLLFALALFVGLPVIVHLVAAGLAVVMPLVIVVVVLAVVWVVVIGRRRF